MQALIERELAEKSIRQTFRSAARSRTIARRNADVGDAGTGPMLAAEQPHAVLLRRQLGGAAAAALPTATSRSNSPYMGPQCAAAGGAPGAGGSAAPMDALQLPGPAAPVAATGSLMAPPLFKPALLAIGESAGTPAAPALAAHAVAASGSCSHASSLAAADQHCAAALLADEASTLRPPALPLFQQHAGEQQQQQQQRAFEAAGHAAPLAAEEEDEQEAGGDVDGRSWQHSLVTCPWLFKPCPDCCRAHTGREVSLVFEKRGGLGAVEAAAGSGLSPVFRAAVPDPAQEGGQSRGPRHLSPRPAPALPSSYASINHSLSSLPPPYPPSPPGAHDLL
jgi:hypothetical protein